MVQGHAVPCALHAAAYFNTAFRRLARMVG